MGGIKREYYKKLQKKYHFDRWHISPYELRKYIQDTANYINTKNAEVVVDIGCGLGEMLRHIKAKTRIGYDIHEEEIEVAKILCKDNIIFRSGSFGEMNIKEPIDYLVTLGFMHGSPETTWQSCYHNIAKTHEIKHFIIDTVPEDEEDGSHYLHFDIILPDNYKLIDKMGPYLGGRFIEVYEKN